jgi:hypothetical protein
VTDGSAAEDITTLRLPGIGWLMQWRSDGCWRELNEIQHQHELDGLHIPDEDEWVLERALPAAGARRRMGRCRDMVADLR